MNLDGLYVVRTPFKAGGKFYEAGLLLTAEDLPTIRLVKVRLNEQKIIPIPKDEKKFDQLQDYFNLRMGIDLRKKVAERVSKGSDSAEQKETSASAIKPTPGTTGSKPKPLSKKPVKPTEK